MIKSVNGWYQERGLTGLVGNLNLCFSVTFFSVYRFMVLGSLLVSQWPFILKKISLCNADYPGATTVATEFTMPLFL